MSGGAGYTRLSKAIRAFLKQSGLAAQLRHQKVYAVWERMLGDRAEHTRIAGLRRGVLEVEVDSAAMMQELEFERRLLERGLQAEVPKPFVERIHFRLASFDGTDDD